ncbi:MAG: beta-lactamase family protein [Rhodoferax sp.]|nr:beta-lactamase family protein [Rhodoferax sp.]
MRLLPLALCFTVLAGCAGAPTRPSTVARGDYRQTQAYATELIEYEMAKRPVPGISIALVDDQRVVWAQGFGFADVERKIPASADTLYRVGSISKLFTDTAAMQLAEQGRIDIDQPVQTYLPGFAPKTREPQAAITVRQLMTHHSGLPRDRLKGFHNPDPRPFALLEADLSDEHVAYAPDQHFSYSNAGIALVGRVLERQSATPFAQHMQRALLLPLGMASSSFDTGASPSPQMSLGYRKREAVPEVPMRDVPAGGLNSSVHDLSRFMSMVFAEGRSGGQQILQAQSVAEMLRPQNTAVPLDANFQVGLGWMLSSLGKSAIHNGGPVAHHGGSIGMFRSALYVLPRHKLGVVVLGNSNTAEGVVDRVATETLKLALQAKTGIEQPAYQQPGWVDAALPEQALRDFPGDYTTTFGLVRVRTHGQGLKAQALGKSFDFRQRSDGLLGIDYALFGFIHLNLGPIGEIGLVRRSVAGRELLFSRVGAQEMLVGQRITPPLDLEPWRKRLGDYAITNLGSDPQVAQRISLVEEHGYLMLAISTIDAPGETLRLILMPVSDTQALLLGPLAQGGETVSVVRVDGVEQLAYSGYLAKKL